MLAYLEAENAYADGVMAPLKPLQDRLNEEIVARIKQDDSSVPVRERGWWYYARFEQGKDYPVHARRRDGDNTAALAIQRANAVGEPADQSLLDVNSIAPGKAHGRDDLVVVEQWVRPGQAGLAQVAYNKQK